MDANFSLLPHYLCALSFVPVNMVVTAIELLCDKDIFPTESHAVVNWKIHGYKHSDRKIVAE